MKFIDECTVNVEAGRGGNGAISFRREFKVDKGGPDGGDGGNGGSIFFVGDRGTNTLYKLRLQRHIRGADGADGSRKNMYGPAGEDVLIKVPLGTSVYVNEVLVADITEDRPYLIARGGRGGRGNRKFKSTRNTVPYLSEKGTPGEHFMLNLSLKVLADIGFVGKPSAGKSTVLSRISNAKPKIADYPFTTLVPQLGFVEGQDFSFVAADLPGLIRGAAEGKGLGVEFLKHISRCRIIAHIIDFGDPTKDPLQDFIEINDELTKFSAELGKRLQVVVANKLDLPAFEAHLATFKAAFPQLAVVAISSLNNTNINLLKRVLYEAYAKVEAPALPTTVSEVTISLPEQVRVENVKPGVFSVTGAEVQKWHERIPLSSHENLMRFNKIMRDIGVWKELLDHGIKDGDLVKIYSYEFTWDEESF